MQKLLFPRKGQEESHCRKPGEVDRDSGVQDHERKVKEDVSIGLAKKLVQVFFRNVEKPEGTFWPAQQKQGS